MADEKTLDKPEENTAKDESEKEKANKKTLAEQITAWVGIISVVITIGLTITTKLAEVAAKDSEAVAKASEKEAKDSEEKAKQSAAVFDQNYKIKQQDLESSKERTERLRFVQTLLDNMLGTNERKKQISENLIKLALREEELAGLYNSFKDSPDEDLKKLATTAIKIRETIKNEEKITRDIAEEKQREGFQSLIDGNYDNAAKAFQEAEDAKNGYNAVYELARLIRANKNQMGNDAKRKEIFKVIADKLSIGAPQDLLAKIKTIANQ